MFRSHRYQGECAGTAAFAAASSVFRSVPDRKPPSPEGKANDPTVGDGASTSHSPGCGVGTIWGIVGAIRGIAGAALCGFIFHFQFAIFHSFPEVVLMFLSVTRELLIGFWENIQVFVLTLVLSIPLGLVVCFGSMSRFTPLRWLTRALVWVIRGTPLMLQLIIIFYGPGLMFDLPSMDRFTAVIVAFSINYACYFSEIYRGGIESIPQGQYEAGQVLGMTKGQIFFHVVLLQVIKRIIAPMGNEIITLVKDTSLSRIIAIYEVIYMGQNYIKKGLIWPLFYTGAFFLIFSGLLTVLLNKLEKKLSYFRG